MLHLHTQNLTLDLPKPVGAKLQNCIVVIVVNSNFVIMVTNLKNVRNGQRNFLTKWIYDSYKEDKVVIKQM